MKKQSRNTGLFALACSAILFGFACGTQENKTEATESTSETTMKHAEAVISGTYPDTSVQGTANFSELENGKVKLDLELTIPAKANQSVAVHIHEHGMCGDMGKEAMGHWNPTNEEHGKWGSEHFHSGDIGNVQLDGSGKGSMTIETDRWTIGGDSTKNLLDRAIIVHGGMDDYTTQPTGNAGGRIGCGVISEKASM